jgi:carboxymethylenebutenolidase
MCDERTIRETDEALRKNGHLSRRSFAALTGAAGFAALLPKPAYALSVSESDVKIKTADGTADCYFVHPSSGAYPGVVVWPDIKGLRPVFRAIGKRLAEQGYAVLVINPYYRSNAAPVVPDEASFDDPPVRERLMGLMKSITPDMTMQDATAFVGFLDQQKAVNTAKKIGTTGYCMGGPMTIRTAAAVPGRIGAIASFHGARLVSQDPSSPHQLIPQTKASALIAIAENDDKSDPEAKTVLRDAYAKAKLPAEIEVYDGAMHGWCVPDFPVYNQAQAEHAWSRLLVLFGKALG